MDNGNTIQKHGDPPYVAAVIHGGPGAGGEMAAVAVGLASQMGVLEPIQSERSISGQVKELKAALQETAALPVSLIGFSWGAWLSLMLAAEHPQLVKKLVLVGCPPFLEKDAARVNSERFNRLTKIERKQAAGAIDRLYANIDTGKTVAELAALFSKTDTYSRHEENGITMETIDFRPEIFQKVWTEAAALRRTGSLLHLLKNIQCPLLAIHGDFDPHPANGVRGSLSAISDDFRFILLDRCGHKPWIEKYAADRFFRILREELR